MFAEGQEVFWAEIQENGVTRTYLFPNELTIIRQLSSLPQKHPVIVVRTGTATIASLLDEMEPNGFPSLPSKPDKMYQVQFFNHPYLVDGKARYSSELIEYLKQLSAAQESTSSSASSEPKEEKKLNLVLQFKKQLEKKLPLPAAPNSESQPTRTLEEALQEARMKRRFYPAPQGSKIDLILAEMEEMKAEMVALRAMLEEIYDVLIGTKTYQ